MTVAAARCNGNVLGSILLRRHVGERRMWAHTVIVGSPGVENVAGLKSAAPETRATSRGAGFR